MRTAARFKGGKGAETSFGGRTVDSCLLLDAMFQEMCSSSHLITELMTAFIHLTQFHSHVKLLDEAALMDCGPWCSCIMQDSTCSLGYSPESGPDFICYTMTLFGVRTAFSERFQDRYHIRNSTR